MYIARGYRTWHSDTPVTTRLVLRRDNNSDRYPNLWWHYVSLGPVLGALLAAVALLAVLGFAGWVEGL